MFVTFEFLCHRFVKFQRFFQRYFGHISVRFGQYIKRPYICRLLAIYVGISGCYQASIWPICGHIWPRYGPYMEYCKIRILAIFQSDFGHIRGHVLMNYAVKICPDNSHIKRPYICHIKGHLLAIYFGISGWYLASIWPICGHIWPRYGPYMEYCKIRILAIFQSDFGHIRGQVLMNYVAKIWPDNSHIKTICWPYKGPYYFQIWPIYGPY